MANYKHGIYTDRKSAELPTPQSSVMNGVAVIGTAPVNLAANPAVNKIVPCYKKAEADAALGYSTDFENYTLMHSVYEQFNKFGAAPVVFINVLDPAKASHVEAVTNVSVTLTAKTGTLTDKGILLDKLVLTNEDKTYKEGDDYVASFADDGSVIISATDDGDMTALASVKAAYSKLKPSGVTAADIIGGVAVDGTRTGLELLDEIYPETGIIPSIIIAPGFSKNASVAAALEAKAQLIYGLTNAMAFVDIDSGANGATTKEQVKTVKNQNTVASRWNTPIWPMAIVDGFKIWGSAVLAAAYQYYATKNSEVPSVSASNRPANIDGVCLEDGTKVVMTQQQVNDYLNAYGIVSFLKLPQWKLWGNNTAAYPNSTAPMNRFTKNVLTLNWMENVFKTQYLASIDKNLDRKLVKDITNEFNIFLNSLTPDYIAGGSILFEDSENPTAELAAGHLKFHTRYADYSPAEMIENTFEYDINILEKALKGDED